jgi:hypothetical protein
MKRKTTLEEDYINQALVYKKELKNCKWWQFKKKSNLKTLVNTSIEMAMMYAINYPGR